MDWQQATLDRVMDEIEGVHHPRVREAAAHVRSALRQACDGCAGSGSPFDRALTAFEMSASSIDAHLRADAALVFPVLRTAGTASGPAAPSSVVLRLVQRMEAEHDAVRALVGRVRRACAACPVVPPAPEWAECARRVHAFADAFEALLVMENGVLFPRAIALEHARRQAGAASSSYVA